MVDNRETVASLSSIDLPVHTKASKIKALPTLMLDRSDGHFITSSVLLFLSACQWGFPTGFPGQRCSTAICSFYITSTKPPVAIRAKHQIRSRFSQALRNRARPSFS